MSAQIGLSYSAAVELGQAALARLERQRHKPFSNSEILAFMNHRQIVRHIISPFIDWVPDPISVNQTITGAR